MSKDEILDYFSDINYAYNDSTRLNTLSNMLDELLEDAVSPWHRVEDGLPKFGEYVLAWEIQGFAVVDKYVGIGDGRWGLQNDGAIYTHWMPLPKPPKED